MRPVWQVIPESARLGIEKGRVAIQFSISREGDVPKLVIASSARSQPLDRASVAGVSASLPFPPLPREFSGDEIRVQLVFLYNNMYYDDTLQIPLYPESEPLNRNQEFPDFVGIPLD